MTGAGAFPFDPARLAALGRLADRINGDHAPPPIAQPVVIDDQGRVTLPVPDANPPPIYDAHASQIGVERRTVVCELHAGLTLQWAPMAAQGGVLIDFRGGQPDGNPGRDAAAAFLTRRGLAALIGDLQAIAAALDAEVST